MHDSLDYMEHDPVHRAYHHGEMTFSTRLRLLGELRAAAQPRRGRARQGLAAAQDAGRPVAAAGQPARLPRLHVGAPRQAAALHGRRARPGVGVGRGARARLVAARPPRAPRRAVAGARPQPRLRRAPRRCGRATTTPAASSGSTPTTPAATSSPSCGAAATGPTWSASPTSPPLPHDDYRIGLPSAGRWEEVVNTDAESYTGSGVGNLGGDRGRRGRVVRPARQRHHRRPPARHRLVAAGVRWLVLHQGRQPSRRLPG